MVIALNHLNDCQKKAVVTTEGRLLVLAGAGSGKTLVLTTRIAYLIKRGVPPSSILGLTFTNKAASEMQHRVAELTDSKDAKQVSLSTFHSFCMSILRKHIHLLGYTPKFSIYDEKDLDRILDNIVRDKLGKTRKLPSIQALKSLIGHARNHGLRAEQIEDDTSSWHEAFTQDVFKQLRSSLRAYNAVDFDDLLYLTLQLFEEHPEILEHYQNNYRYIMIDEYQDTNPIQFRITSLLSQKFHNLCVVGDDDQSIYSWRGACVDNILKFDHDKLIKLEQNYRSTNIILNAANAVIKNNSSRHHKTLWSNQEGQHKIKIFHAPDELKEVEAVLHRIVRVKTTWGLQWKDIAILYRSNHLSRAFEIALMRFLWRDQGEYRRGIPYKVFGGTEFYLRKEVQDLFAYLKVIDNPSDQSSLLRIINYPRRGIGDKALEHLTVWNRENNLSLWETLKAVSEERLKLDLTPKTTQSIREFTDLIERLILCFKEKSLLEGAEELVRSLDLEIHLKEESKNPRVFEMKWDNVGELLSSLEEFQSSSEDRSLTSFLSQSMLKEDGPSRDRNKKQNENCLQLMTFHSAKGLEFPACFLVGVEDHIIPHERSVKDTGIDEERRLMYVAITRAKRFLTISMAQKRKRMGKEMVSKPSRFLFEIPKDLLEPTRWDSI